MSDDEVVASDVPPIPAVLVLMMERLPCTITHAIGVCLYAKVSLTVMLLEYNLKIPILGVKLLLIDRI